MWDLEVIREMNERAYRSSLEMINEGVNSTAPAPEPQPVFPLASLAAKLIVGPPSIIRLVDLLGNSDSVAQFLNLIREFTPEHEHEIMAEIEDGRRIHRFCQHFEYRHFPLEDPTEAFEGYLLEDFIDYIPVHLMGFSCDDYSEFMSYRDGFILLLAMVENPYVRYDDNERVPILEEVKKLVGKSLMELIPPDGWSLEDIHTMFDDSEYEGVATFADWIHQSTGCMQMDTNYAEYGPETWSTRVIDELTQEWPQVGEIQDRMFKMHEWLEKDMRQNFAKVLAVMLGVKRLEDYCAPGKEKPEVFFVPKEQMPFPLDEDGQVKR